MYSLTKTETETTITFNDEGKEALIYTNNKAWMRKLDNLCQNSLDAKRIREDEYSKTYKVPKKWIKVVRPKLYSEEKREEMAQRARERFHKGG